MTITMNQSLQQLQTTGLLATAKNLIIEEREARKALREHIETGTFIKIGNGAHITFQTKDFHYKFIVYPKTN